MWWRGGVDAMTLILDCRSSMVGGMAVGGSRGRRICVLIRLL